MTVNNIKNDAIVELPVNNGYPILNGGTFCFVGQAGTGKTSRMNELYDQYVIACKKSTYSLDEPFVNNGPITHTYYVSPSIKSDMTLLNGNTGDKILIEATRVNIQNLCSTLDMMRTEVY